MKTSRAYRATDTICGIVEDNYNVLPLLSRFSVPLGVADLTVADVCSRCGINASAFLLLLNYIGTGVIQNDLMDEASATDVADFLHNSHDYFLDYKFPHIRANLVKALSLQPSPSNAAITKFFDDFVDAVRRHFGYEENEVFPYVKTLARGERSEYCIDTFRRHHDEVECALTELKNIIMRFYRTDVPNLMYDVLVDIYNAEEDLISHADIENHLLIPMVEREERRQNTVKCTTNI